jgi:hypothetical protein
MTKSAEVGCFCYHRLAVSRSLFHWFSDGSDLLRTLSNPPAHTGRNALFVTLLILVSVVIIDISYNVRQMNGHELTGLRKCGNAKKVDTGPRNESRNMTVSPAQGLRVAVDNTQ